MESESSMCKDASEWTDTQREFVGSTFPTPKGGTLTVVGVSRERAGKTAIFLCECSICNVDKELFPDPFSITKVRLNKGKVPCGCVTKGNLTKEQDILLANRFFIKEGRPNLKAIDMWIDGKEKVFHIECDICGKDPELWYEPFLTTRSNLFSGRYPCGCVKGKDLTNEQDLIMMDRYLRSVDSTLTPIKAFRIEGRSNRGFILECSICSKDKRLWPYGSITSTKGQITSGCMPCGCSTAPRWSEYQMIVRVRRQAKKMGYICLGWAEPYKGKETKIILKNNTTSNIWDTTNIQHFLAGGGDPSSKTNGGGFDRTLPSTLYLNKFYNIEGHPVVLKFGITNNKPRKRRRQQELASNLTSETIYTYYSENGKKVEDLEKTLKGVICLERVKKEILPDGYTEAVHYKHHVENFIINYIEMLIKQ